MRMDQRCKRLNELSDRYHLLFKQVAERCLIQYCEKVCTPEMLCLGDYMLLFTVGEVGDRAAHMADISRQLNINPSTATRRVNRLLADGLVSKDTAPDDDRRYDLRLTEGGRALLDWMDERLYDAVQKTYEPVTEEELQTVYRYLEKCIGQLEKLVSE